MNLRVLAENAAENIFEHHGVREKLEKAIRYELEEDPDNTKALAMLSEKLQPVFQRMVYREIVHRITMMEREVE